MSMRRGLAGATVAVLLLVMAGSMSLIGLVPMKWFRSCDA